MPRPAERVTAPRGEPPERSELDAHRAAGRRVRVALVGRDPDGRRDPRRTQQRALAASAVLAVLGATAALVVGLVRGDADWRAAGLVRAEPSGALYAVRHHPDRLTPVLNLASGRLVAAAAGSGDGAEPVRVRDDALADAPRTAAVGIPTAPATLPEPQRGTLDPLPGPGPDGWSVSRWAVCDAVRLDPAAPDPVAHPARATVVRAAAGPRTGPAPDPVPGARGLTDDRSLLLRGDDGAVWLVTGGRKARVDPADGAVVRALDLTGVRPRVASAAFLESLPDAPALVRPVVPGSGNTPDDPAVARLGVPVGSVVAVAGTDRFALVLRDGVQDVPAVVASLVRYADPDPAAAAAVPVLPAAAVAGLPRAAALDLAAYPAGSGHPVDYAQAPAVCAVPDPRTGRTVVLAAPPGPGPESGVTPWPMPRIAGARVAGAGAYVVPVVPGQAPDLRRGAVVDSGGRVFAVPDPGAARALGLGAPSPAPRAVVDLLPRGPELDPRAAGLTR